MQHLLQYLGIGYEPFTEPDEIFEQPLSINLMGMGSTH
jgi:hypothetical protein